MKDRVVSFLNLVINWIKLNYKILTLSIIIAAISFPEYELIYVPGIDGPLPWIFNYLADGHYGLGKYFLFPHGPLAFLLYPLPMGNNLNMTIGITFLCALLLNVSVFQIYRLKEQGYVFPFIVLLVLESIADIQLLLIALTLSYIILSDLTNRRSYLVLAVFFCVFNLFIKTYGGIICGLILGSELIHRVLIKRKIGSAIQIPVYFVLFYFLFRLALYQTLSGSYSFLRGQFELSSDNSEAVSYYPDNNWWMIGICLFCLVLLPFLTREKKARYLWGLMLLPLFGAWKHAMARADDTHLSGFTSMIALVVLFLWLLSDQKKIAVVVAGIISISAFTLNMALVGYLKEKNIPLFRAFNLTHLITNKDSISIVKNNMSKDKNAGETLPDSILKIIGDEGVDIFPWNYSIIPVNHLNWRPRPSIYSYASYTSWLDQQNSIHLRSDSAAHFIIWDLDELGGGMKGIDYRYLLNEGPKMTIDFFSHYILKYKDTRYMVFERMPEALEVQHKTIFGPQKLKYNSWINVPVSTANCILRAKVKIGKSAMGHLKSTFYKGNSFIITYETSDKNILSHKFIPKNAADGLWISPFILDPKNDCIEPQVNKIRISCSEEEMVQPEFLLEFEVIQFNSGINFCERFFRKVECGRNMLNQ